MPRIRVVGDCHGVFGMYKDIIAGVENSIQVGDLGFRYDQLKNVDPDVHKFFCGNHDNHDVAPLWPHNLGKYGELNGGMFFVSGGFSIDRQVREQMTPLWGKTYWKNEELSVKELKIATELYIEARPEIMLTHEAPRSIIHRFTNGSILSKFGFDPATFTTRTSEALEIMFQKHQPKKWFFGHFHRNWSETIKGCKFRCLEEFGFEDIEVDF